MASAPRLAALHQSADEPRVRSAPHRGDGDGDGDGRGVGAARALRALVVCASLAILAACGAAAPPEQRLRTAMRELQASIESRDAAAIEARLSRDFIGPDGLDRASARRLASASFLRYRDVGLTLAAVDPKVQGDHATVSFTAALSGGSGRPLPEAARLYQVETGWREEDGEWRITSAQWQARW